MAILARRSLLVLQILLLIDVAGTAPASAQPREPAIESAPASIDNAKLAEVENYLREQMRVNQIPSISVAVVRNGKTEMLKSYGIASLEWNAGSTPITAYQLASATKPLTGTALMLMVQEGSLSLDDRITKYIPDAPPEWGRISIRHLATHSSGISDDLGPGDPKTAAEAVTRAAAKPLDFEPGSRSSYGIGGYAVLQHIIEHVSGMSYPDFLRDRLFAPLGMENTSFDHSTNDGPFRVANVIPNRAGVYSWEEGEQRIFWFHFGSHAYTAGGLLSTPRDLAKWAAALDSGKFLSDESLRHMFGSSASDIVDVAAAGDEAAPVGGDAAADSGSGTVRSDPQFGIGWVRGIYRGRPTVGHSGGPALADILRFPDEKLTIVVLANQSKMYPYLAQGVADILVPAPAAAALEATLSDSNPALTGRLKAFLAAASTGEIPEEAFTFQARTELIPQLRPFLIPYARSLGAPTDLYLVEETTENDLVVRVYRTIYGKKHVQWRFDLSADGLIASLRPTPE